MNRQLTQHVQPFPIAGGRVVVQPIYLLALVLAVMLFGVRGALLAAVVMFVLATSGGGAPGPTGPVAPGRSPSSDFGGQGYGSPRPDQPR